MVGGWSFRLHESYKTVSRFPTMASPGFTRQPKRRTSKSTGGVRRLWPIWKVRNWPTSLSSKAWSESCWARMKRIKCQDPTELNWDWIKAYGGQEARLRYLLKLLAAKRIQSRTL